MIDTPADTLTPLVCDLLEWLERKPRSHADVIDGWRTSCPGCRSGKKRRTGGSWRGGACWSK